MKLFELLFPKKAEELINLKIQIEFTQKEYARYFNSFFNEMNKRVDLEDRLSTCQKTYADYVKETDKKISKLKSVITKYRKQFGPYKIKGKRAA